MIPPRKDYKGTPLIGGYAIDEEGVPAEKVTIVDNGKLKESADVAASRPGFR